MNDINIKNFLGGIFMGKKILVAYFSASGTTARTAKDLAGKLLNGVSGTEMKTWAESVL